MWGRSSLILVFQHFLRSFSCKNSMNHRMKMSRFVEVCLSFCGFRLCLWILCLASLVKHNRLRPDFGLAGSYGEHRYTPFKFHYYYRDIHRLRMGITEGFQTDSRDAPDYISDGSICPCAWYSSCQLCCLCVVLYMCAFPWWALLVLCAYIPWTLPKRPVTEYFNLWSPIFYFIDLSEGEKVLLVKKAALIV